MVADGFSTSFSIHSSYAPPKNRIRGIKELIDSGTQHVPANYIRPPHERPCLSQQAPQTGSIPVISLCNLLGDGRSRVVQEIGRACEEWGFFQVIDHGVPQTLRDRIWKAAREFFDLPAEERMRLYTEDIQKPVGYWTGFNPGMEGLLKWKDSLMLRRSPDIEFDGFQQAPEFFREPAIEFLDALRALAVNLWGAILESLGMDANSFQRELPKLSDDVLGVNYYPPCPDPSLTLGLDAHSDIGLLTILMQDEVAGLQVLKGDKWRTVEPEAGSFVVNVADQIQILTNGKYKSVEHRAVTNAERPRMSIPYFVWPGWGARVAPLAEFVREDNNPALYKETVYGDYVKNVYSTQLNGKSNLRFAQLHSSSSSFIPPKA